MVLRGDVLVLKDGRQHRGNVSIGPNGVCLQKPDKTLEYYDIEEVHEIVKGAEAETALPEPAPEPEPEPEPEVEEKPFFVPQAIKLPEAPDLSTAPSDVEHKVKRADLVLRIFGGLGGLANLIGYIMILANAFGDSAGAGLKCMFLPFYILYFAFAEYDARSRTWGLLLYFGGGLLIVVGWILAFTVMFK